MRCIPYAVSQYHKHGGYIVLRKTRFNRFRWIIWFHMLWLPPECPKGGACQGLESFVPDIKTVEDINSLIKIFPPLWYKGHVKKGDQP